MPEERQQSKPLFMRKESPGYQIGMASRVLTNELHQQFKLGNVDVTPEQWVIMDELWRKDGSSQCELAVATNRDQPSTSRLIDNLVKKNFVYRSQDPNDKRSNLIFLTEKGIQIHSKMVDIVKRTNEQTVQGINSQDLSICMKVLAQITYNAKTP